MNNSNQSFQVHCDNSEEGSSGDPAEGINTPTDVLQFIDNFTTPLTSYVISNPPPPLRTSTSTRFRKPLQSLGYARNMASPIPLEDMFAKATDFAQQTTWVPGAAFTGVFQFKKLPPEIREKIVEEYLRMCAPSLSVLKEQAKIPITRDVVLQAKGSQLLDSTIAHELESSLLSSLLVCKAWYEMVAGYMTRNTVYVDGPFNLKRLLLFEKRRNKFKLEKEDFEKSAVDKPANVHTHGVKYYLTSDRHENKNGWTTGGIKGPPRYFDCHGEGRWWKRPGSHSSNELMSHVYREGELKSLDWSFIPGWVRGGAPNIGGHLNYGDEDKSIIDGSNDGSIINFGSVINDQESIKNNESYNNNRSSQDKNYIFDNYADDDDGGYIKNDRPLKNYKDIKGKGIMKYDDDDRSNEKNTDESVSKDVYEPGSFLAHAKTLILGPGVSDIHKTDVPGWIYTVDCPPTPGEESSVSAYYRIPGTHLLNKVLGNPGRPSNLQNLIISGHIWANPWFFMPRPVKSDLRFLNLTNLTLSLPAPVYESDSPMSSLRYFRDRCADRHLCMLLTGKHKTFGGKVIEEGSTFLNTLEYLHMRGPGTHCCSELFNASWKRLNSVTIELPTTAAICEPSTDNFIDAIETTFLDRFPNAEVRVSLRAIMPRYDSDFRFYFWRMMKENLPGTLSYPGRAYSLAPAPNGVDLILFEKNNEQRDHVRVHPDWVAAIDNIQREEVLCSNVAVQYFMRRDGVDARTMVWELDHLWMAAENSALGMAIAEENGIAAENAALLAGENPTQEVKEPDYTRLRVKADNEWHRQNTEYMSHINEALKAGLLAPQV
ncbi:hypothetical protein L873DRAFT_1793493 [Choiromyces venosus 120613-1]|uniref:Uncharacterized protein n=1 Tax=Choiromyces venosus 120613-1 TaxID=1336337 RepID=A0A3N4JI88_9PEZI|nr:hypothetical protein L873DRAFT_1793493 [Choiromyces venosus 120613-1]